MRPIGSLQSIEAHLALRALRTFRPRGAAQRDNGVDRLIGRGVEIGSDTNDTIMGEVNLAKREPSIRPGRCGEDAVERDSNVTEPDGSGHHQQAALYRNLIECEGLGAGRLARAESNPSGQTQDCRNTTCTSKHS